MVKKTKKKPVETTREALRAMIDDTTRTSEADEAAFAKALMFLRRAFA